MTHSQPNLKMLCGVVSKPTYLNILKGERLKQDRAYRRITLKLRKELGDTEETRQILEAIKPE